jgi:hypothetical protein
VVTPCSERDRLEATVLGCLKDINNFSDKLRAAIKAGDGNMSSFDTDLENAVGAKERGLGALTQHRREHGC